MTHGAALAIRDVRLVGFTVQTDEFLAVLIDEWFGHPMPVIPLTSAAALFFVLRATPEDQFPGGKWATIQHLEGLIDKAVGR